MSQPKQRCVQYFLFYIKFTLLSFDSPIEMRIRSPFFLKTDFFEHYKLTSVRMTLSIERIYFLMYIPPAYLTTNKIIAFSQLNTQMVMSIAIVMYKNFLWLICRVGNWYLNLNRTIETNTPKLTLAKIHLVQIFCVR